MEKQDRELYFARAVIGAIENVKVPMLMYEEEKEVVKKALQMYINKIEMDTRYAAKKMKNATRNYNGPGQGIPDSGGGGGRVECIPSRSNGGNSGNLFYSGHEFWETGRFGI